MQFSQAFVLAAIPFLASAYIQDDTYTVLARRAAIANAELDNYVELMARSYEDDYGLYARDADFYDDGYDLYARDFDDDDHIFSQFQRRGGDPPTANYAGGTYNHWSAQPDAGKQLGDLRRVTQEAVDAGVIQHPDHTHIGGRQPPHSDGSQADHVATVGERHVGGGPVTTHHLPAHGPLGDQHYSGGDHPFQNKNQGKAKLPAKGPPMGITHPPTRDPPSPDHLQRSHSDPAAGRARSPSPQGRRGSRK